MKTISDLKVFFNRGDTSIENLVLKQQTYKMEAIPKQKVTNYFYLVGSRVLGLILKISRSFPVVTQVEK